MSLMSKLVSGTLDGAIHEAIDMAMTPSSSRPATSRSFSCTPSDFLNEGVGIRVGGEGDREGQGALPSEELSFVLSRMADEAEEGERGVALQVNALAGSLRNHGYGFPVDLLALLEDPVYFHEMTSEMGLEKKTRKLLWKALEGLDVLMDPLKGPDGMSQLKSVFYKYCDRLDQKGRPSMSIDGLEHALNSLNVSHEEMHLKDTMRRMDSNLNSDIDIDEFLGQLKHPDMPTWRRLAQTRLQRGVLRDKEKMRHAATQLQLEKDLWAQQVADNREVQRKIYQAKLEERKREREKRREALLDLQRQRAILAARPRTRALNNVNSRNAVLSFSWLEASMPLVDMQTSHRLRRAWEDAFPLDPAGRPSVTGLCQTALKYAPPTQTPKPPIMPPDLNSNSSEAFRMCATNSSSRYNNLFQYTLQYAPQAQSPEPAPAPPPDSDDSDDER